jgi:hypothetical protein
MISRSCPGKMTHRNRLATPGPRADVSGINAGSPARTTGGRNTMLAYFVSQLSDQLSNIVSNLGVLLGGIL